MPLPTGGPWPPKQLDAITPRLAEWSAWYEGDPVKLRAAYQGTGASAAYDTVSGRRGGIAGTLSRLWWGRPIGDLTKRQDQLHVPIAADLCQASADLLFSEPPTIKVADAAADGATATQRVLTEAADDGIHAVYAEGAEVGAALGGVYLRVTWDRDIAPEGSFFTAVHADAAVPEFRWGRLVAVTFWRDLAVDGQKVTRHLERHELDTQGIGIVLHGLFEGTVDDLGRVAPLTEHHATAGLAAHVDADGAISTESPGLAVIYVPNQRPQRRWRTHPVGASLGRSDLDGVEGLMDALDETYSSWMRDIRLAKSRIIVPEYMLTSYGPGRGAGFDLDQDVYSPIKMPPGDGGGKGEITLNQFAIRVAEHQATAQQLVEDILRTVGYSKQTFGEGTDGAAMTATEVTSKERRSYMTRDRKIRLWRPAIADLWEKKLHIDKAIFGRDVEPQRPTVDFGDAVQADPEALARTNQLLFQAQSASTETRVRAMHPDWDEIQIGKEVDRILSEFSMSVPDAVDFNPATDS